MTSSNKPTTPAELMSFLDEQLRTRPSRTQGINIIFAFDVSGERGGTWWIESKDGTGATHQGTHAEPDVTIYLNDDVLVRLGNHELDGGEAYVSGLLTVEGDASKAMFLAQIFGD
jgi:putative sterol carrier protein